MSDYLNKGLGKLIVFDWAGIIALAQRNNPRTRQPEAKYAGRIRAEQLAAVARLSPFMMAAAACNAVMVLFAFWHTGHNDFLIAWSTIIPLATWIGIKAARARIPLSNKRSASTRGINRAVVNASVLGCFWGLLPVVLFPGASSAEQVLLTCLAAGMLCGAGFALSAIPQAAAAAAIPIATGSVGALFLDQHPLFWMASFLIAIYTCAVVLTAYTYHKLFVSHLLGHAKMKKQGEIIQLLLRDFEDNTSDWLWKTDNAGRLTSASKRMAEIFACDSTELVGRKLTDLVAPDDASSGDTRTAAIASLKSHFVDNKPFRDCIVETSIKGQKRWLSLTGSPLHNTEGKIIGFRGVGSDVTAEKHAEAELAHLARHDSLTGLANRLYFRAMLHNAMQKNEQSARAIALLCLDLNQFKFINDTRGHPFGDALLRAVAGRLRDCVGTDDLLTRLGSDEFAIAQMNMPQPASATTLAETLIESFKEPFSIQGSQITIDISVGICIAPCDGSDVETIMKNVDMAHARAKCEPTSNICLFEPEMGRRFQQTRELEAALKKALSNDEFYLSYQPQVCSSCHGITGFEALVRWQHHERGNVEPGEFIPIAEAMGLIPQLGEIVIRKACDAAAIWPDDITVAVNLSPLQFYDGDIVETVRQSLASSGLAPERLELEITEGVLFKNTEQVLVQLNELKKIGVTISMDDFGTGYSSLAYLWRFPFDKVKIDQSFVFALGKDRNVEEILRTIVALAQILQVHVVAEGVETDGQSRYLTQIGCDKLQGFLFGRPMTQEQLAVELLKRQRCDADCDHHADDSALPLSLRTDTPQYQSVS